MTDVDVHRLLLTALLDPSDETAAEAGRTWLDAVDVQVIGYEQARLLPMLYKRLHRLGVAQPPLLRGTYRKAWVQNQLRFRAAAAFLDALDRQGVPSVLLKGASLVPAYGGDWGVRDMSDVDALVRPHQLGAALAQLEADGWVGQWGVTPRSVGARLAATRHSWNFVHPAGHQIDLHWRVFMASRGDRCDQAFWEAAIPIELGLSRSLRWCDGDLLLHVLEHAGHDEAQSRLQWMVDAVTLLRSTADLGTTAQRLAQQAAEHDLLDAVRARLDVMHTMTGEPRIADLQRATDAQRPRRVHILRAYRPGGTGVVGAARLAMHDRFASGLVEAPIAWKAYVTSGRRPIVERMVRRGGRSLTTTVERRPPPADGEWAELTDPAVLDGVCGPGWSFPVPEHGVWSEGPEARMTLQPGGARWVDLELVVLARHGGPPRSVTIRVDGHVRARLEAADDADGLRTITVPLPAVDRVELSFRIRDPARPIDLGLNADARALGVMLHRFRLRRHPV